MSRHLDKILANAERQLAATAAKRPTEVLPLYKKFLKIEEHRLRLRHQAGGGGREICAGRAELIDVLLRHVFGQAKAGAAKGTTGSVALMALGGYGRRELNPFSDVDVMFLHRQKQAAFRANSVKWSNRFFISFGTLVSKSVTRRARSKRPSRRPIAIC